MGSIQQLLLKDDAPRYSRTELERIIDEHVICIKNAERNRMILKRAWFDGVSQERIAEEFGLTPRQVQNIIYKAQDLVFKHL